MIVSSKNKEFDLYLKCFLETQSWLSPIYTQSALRYYFQRPSDEKRKIQDKSFILLWEDEPVIAFRGATVETNSKMDLLAYEIPCISIENRAILTTKAGKTFLNEFDRIIEEVNGLIIYRDFLIDSELSTLSNHLLRKGAKATLLFSKVLDLNKDELKLKSHIRKSYSSLINWGLREMQPQILDSSNVTLGSIEDFRKLHTHEAGRETRSKESWRRQFEMVQAGEAFVVLAQLNNELVSAGFFMHSKTNCYYGVSASRRDMFEKPMFHSLMWTAILHSKKLGCRWFEVGEQLYPNHPPDKPPSKKELGISEFKAGFGGETRMFLDLKLDKSST